MSDDIDVDVPDLEEGLEIADEPELVDEPEPGELQSDDDDKPLTSSQQRFQKLANERREKELEAQTAREQAEFYKRQLDQFQSQQQQKQPPEVIDPQERTMRMMQADQQRINFQMWDLNDRNEFLNKANKSDALNRYVEKVEAKLIQLRSQGINASRIQLAKEMLADDVIAKQSQVGKIKREAAAKVQTARGEPLKVKSDVGRSKVEESLESRLRNTFI